MKFLLLILSASLSLAAGKKLIVCYWGSWSIYRAGVANFDTTNIDPQLCTNIIYSFAGLNQELKIDSLDSWADVSLGGFANVTGLKQNNTDLKISIAIGGWNEGSLKYSVAAGSEESRERLATSILNFLAFYGFDGIDLDWEYPSSRGGISEDKKNFPLLLQAIKDKLAPWNFTLSIAVPFEIALLDTGYDVNAIASIVDYVHVMAYDYVSPTSNVTGLSSPLSVINNTVQAWIDGGMPADKLILGLQGYARAFDLKDPSKHDVGDAVNGPAIAGFYTLEDGFLSYYEVLNEFDIGKNQNPDPWTQVSTDGTNYAYDDNGQWLTYENEETIKVKVEYALENNLGGVMFWALDLDDFNGQFGIKYPLLTAANEIIKASESKM